MLGGRDGFARDTWRNGNGRINWKLNEVHTGHMSSVQYNFERLV